MFGRLENHKRILLLVGGFVVGSAPARREVVSMIRLKSRIQADDDASSSFTTEDDFSSYQTDQISTNVLVGGGGSALAGDADDDEVIAPPGITLLNPSPP